MDPDWRHRPDHLRNAEPVYYNDRDVKRFRNMRVYPNDVFEGFEKTIPIAKINYREGMGSTYVSYIYYMNGRVVWDDSINYKFVWVLPDNTIRNLIVNRFAGSVSFKRTGEDDIPISKLVKRLGGDNLEIDVTEPNSEYFFYENLTEEQRKNGTYGKRRRAKTARRTRRSKK